MAALPVPAELLVTEDYPGAAAHTVLMVRPDGHLVAAMPGVDPAELHACADTVRGGGSGDGAARAGDGAAPGESGTDENGGAEEDGGAAAARGGTGGGGSAGSGAPEAVAPTAADGVSPARGTPR